MTVFNSYYKYQYLVEIFAEYVTYLKQDCIPVGCVPTAAVAASVGVRRGGEVGQTPSYWQTPL